MRSKRPNSCGATTGVSIEEPIPIGGTYVANWIDQQTISNLLKRKKGERIQVRLEVIKRVRESKDES